MDGRLVPVERGIVTGDGEWWDWIVGPGKTWHQGDDGDWSRASVPFALIEKNANCMHQGVLTFRYRGEAEVSRVAYQVSQETCRYFQFNAWGTAAATRTVDASIDRAASTAGLSKRGLRAACPSNPSSSWRRTIRDSIPRVSARRKTSRRATCRSTECSSAESITAAAARRAMAATRIATRCRCRRIRSRRP